MLVDDEDEQHPDDVLAEQESKVMAALHIQRFFDDNRDRFIALVQTYADGEARDTFEELRDDFWGNLPWPVRSGAV